MNRLLSVARDLLLSGLFAWPLFVSAQENVLNHRAFNDLKLTNGITKSYGDSTCVFHVAVLDDQPEPDLSKRYFWFHQGEMRSTQGQFTGKLLHGPYERFDRNGILLEKGNFDNGLRHGQWLLWYSNGNILSHYTWAEGQRTGDFELYDPQGRKTIAGSYKEGKLNGKVYYYTNGVEERTEKYRQGKLVKQRTKKQNKSETATGEKKTRKKSSKAKKDAVNAQPEENKQTQN
jgi:MORN repeat variant